MKIMKNFRRMLYLKVARMGRGSNTPVPSIISFGTKIKGDILGGDVIHIDGRLEGNVCCDELIIGSRGQVLGQVRAKTLSLYGTLQGSAEAENLFIAGSARLTGDALHGSIAIEPGAYIEGRCIRINKPAELKPAVKVEALPSAVKSQTENKSNLFKAVSGEK